MTNSTNADGDAIKVTIIGVGGVGGWLAEGVVRMLEFSRPGSVLVLVDADTFEHKNAARQSFTELGNKAEVKAAEIAPLFPRTYVVAHPRFVVPDIDGDPNALEDSKVAAGYLLTDGDVVFVTVDNFAARKCVFDAAQRLDNIDVFTGGNDEAYFGSVYHYCRRDGVDITDHPGEYHAEYIDPPDRNPGAMSCEERARIDGGTQLIATNMAVAAWSLAKLHRHLTNTHAVAASEIYFDLGEGVASAFARDAALVDANAVEELVEENTEELVEATG